MDWMSVTLKAKHGYAVQQKFANVSKQYTVSNFRVKEKVPSKKQTAVLFIVAAVRTSGPTNNQSETS
jgi:hypothetical protein